jgi:hypothetical protein
MKHHYTVGTTQGSRSEAVSVDAEDALIAALMVKHRHPGVMITYVRKRNARGDLRHPPHAVDDREP